MDVCLFSPLVCVLFIKMEEGKLRGDNCRYASVDGNRFFTGMNVVYSVECLLRLKASVVIYNWQNISHHVFLFSVSPFASMPFSPFQITLIALY